MDRTTTRQNRLSNRIMDAMRQQKTGTVFTPKDFLAMGSRAAVDQALSRLVKRGHLRRVARGFYDLPVQDSWLGVTLAPSVDAVLDALKRSTHARLQPAGALAANTLGLSTQVPGKNVYLTTGASRVMHLNTGGTTQEIVFRHAPAKVMAGAGHDSGWVISALTFLGQNNIDDGVIDRLSNVLTSAVKRELLRDAKHSYDWVQVVADRISHN